MSDPEKVKEETKKTAIQSAKAWGGQHSISLLSSLPSILAYWL
jgi:hypothetical protein